MRAYLTLQPANPKWSLGSGRHPASPPLKSAVTSGTPHDELPPSQHALKRDLKFLRALVRADALASKSASILSASAPHVALALSAIKCFSAIRRYCSAHEASDKIGGVDLELWHAAHAGVSLRGRVNASF